MEELDFRWPGAGTSKAGNVPSKLAIGGPSKRRKYKIWYRNEENTMVTAFLCAVTQEDQDKVDEEHEREAMQNLVQTWLERLQLISVIVSKAMFYEASQKI